MISMHHGSQSVKIVKKGKVKSTIWSSHFISSISCQGWFIPHPCLCFLNLRWHAFTLIPYNPSQVIEMLTIFANLVTKFECVVFGSYLHILCCTLLHAWGYSTPLVSISSCTCSIQIFCKCMM